MAISSQENINIGTQNQAAGSDSLYVAFTKTQNNFTKLFTTASPVTTVNSGNGITATILGNTLTVNNTGVTGLFPGTGLTVDNNNGIVTISVTGDLSGNIVAGVTSVGATSNTLTVTNTPIISTGNVNIELANLGLVAATYTHPSVTVDKYGRVTSIANTTGVGTVTSIAVTGGGGIQVSGSPITSNGTITVTNTGVTQLTAGAGISLSSTTGAVTIAATGSVGGTGTVTTVNVNSPGNTLSVANGVITTSGTIGLDFKKLPVSATAPVSPAVGWMYYDSAMDKVRVYLSAGWANITTS